MTTAAFDPPCDQLLATAERVAAERPEIDLEIAREVFEEAATLLYNGLALEGLDDHDAHLVVAGMYEDVVSGDPNVAAAYEISARFLQP